VARVPRRYRGTDLHDRAKELGFASQRTEDVPEAARTAPQPLLSGTAGGHAMSLHALARSGVHLLGSLDGASGHALRFRGNLLENVALGDVVANKLRGAIDGFVEKAGRDAAPVEPDPADLRAEKLEDMAAQTELHLARDGIRAIIWATGFTGDFSYLPGELLDERGLPRHHGGEIAPGLYCLGLGWPRTRWSGLVAGAQRDAEALAERIARGPSTAS
jgi:putative flavoprotein involved in K+ transport